MSIGKNQENHRTKGIMYILFSYGVWGVLPLYWKALDQVSSKEILAHRVIWSFLFVLILMTVMKRWKEVANVFHSKRNVFGLFVSSLLISCNWYIYIWAVNHGHIIETSLGYYINPLLSIFLGLIVLHEKLNRMQFISLLFASLAVLIQTIEFGQFPWVSILLAATFGVYGLAKKMVQVDSLTGLGLETLFVTPIALAYLVNEEMKHTASFLHLSIQSDLLLVGAGIVTALPLLWFAIGAKQIPLSMLGFLQYLSPTLTLLIGIFIYKEPFTNMHVISFGLIWIALLIFSFSFHLPTRAKVKQNVNERSL